MGIFYYMGFFKHFYTFVRGVHIARHIVEKITAFCLVTLCTFQILGGCQGRRTGVGVTTVSNSLILGGWVTKVLKNGDKK